MQLREMKPDDVAHASPESLADGEGSNGCPVDDANHLAWEYRVRDSFRTRANVSNCRR